MNLYVATENRNLWSTMEGIRLGIHTAILWQSYFLPIILFTNQAAVERMFLFLRTRIYWNVENTMSIQFQVWKRTKKKKKHLFENKHLSFFHPTTIKLQCENLTSVHVAARGQPPNTRMMIICYYFNTLCFVGKKKRSSKPTSYSCLHSVNFTDSSAKETIVTNTPCVFPALQGVDLIPSCTQ